MRTKKISIFFLMGFLVSCIEQPSICDFKKPTNAGFKILQYTESFDKSNFNSFFISTDTVALLPIKAEDCTTITGYQHNVPIYFKADDNTAKEYVWRIGRDDRTFDTPMVYLEFPKEAEGIIPVQLIIKREPDKQCFPNDDGIDTVKKVFYFIRLDKHPLEGVWKGYHEGDVNDTATFDIGWANKSMYYQCSCNQFEECVFSINSVSKMKNSEQLGEYYTARAVLNYNFKSFALADSGNSGDTGIGYINEDGTLIYEYTYFIRTFIKTGYYDYKQIKKKFIGKKVR